MNNWLRSLFYNWVFDRCNYTIIQKDENTYYVEVERNGKTIALREVTTQREVTGSHHAQMALFTQDLSILLMDRAKKKAWIDE